jgi:micrococcal nuclease
MIDPCYRYRATVRRVLDADTFILDVDLGFRVTASLNIRLNGYDAPELREPRGQEARAFAELLLKEAREIVIETYKDQRSFERWIGDVYLDGVNIAERLIAEGFVKHGSSGGTSV